MCSNIYNIITGQFLQQAVLYLIGRNANLVMDIMLKTGSVEFTGL